MYSNLMKSNMDYGTSQKNWVLRFSIKVIKNTTLTFHRTTAWHVIRLWMQETASRHVGWLRIYWISSPGQPTKGGHPACGLG